MTLLVGVGCLVALLAVVYFRFRPVPNTRALVSLLPVEGATVVFIDVKSLRTAGILDLLAGNRVAEEPDYRAFVAATGFDYRTDLDVVACAIRKRDAYFAVVGRFDWSSLKKYALNQGGSCLNGVCDVPASERDRWISFRPMKSNVLALSSTGSKLGSVSVYERAGAKFPEVPSQPIWVSFPAAAMEGDSVPAGTKLFAKALAGARDVTFALDRVADGGFEATMVANCQGAVEASELLNQLSGVTGVLKNYLARLNKQPNPADLSAVLTGGAFERRDSRVYGRWPVPRPFLESLAGGSL